MRGILVLSLLAALCPACNGGEDTDNPANIVVAEVNGEPVKGDRFLRQYSLFKRRTKVQTQNDEALEKELREGILDHIIRAELIAKEAEKAGVAVSPEAEEKEIGEMLKGISPARLQVILEKEGQTYDEWKENVRQNLLIEKLIAAKIAPQVDVPEADVKRYFDEHPDEFKRAAQARVFHVLCDTYADADRARLELTRGAKFDEVAQKFSKSPEGAAGGDLGNVSQGDMPKELDDIIFKLKAGELSKVVQSPYGFHVLKVTEFAKPRSMTFDEARNGIRGRMFQERLDGKFELWLKETRNNAQVKVYSERLSRL